MRVYKIQDTTTGLFSTGGYCPRWTKVGKTWASLTGVKLHLKLYTDNAFGLPRRTIPVSWVLVPFDMEMAATVPVKDLLK